MCKSGVGSERRRFRDEIRSVLKKKRPTYLLILKLTDRSTADKDIFKAGMISKKTNIHMLVNLLATFTEVV